MLLIWLGIIECVCSSFVDIDGHGNCQTKVKKQYGCYVKEPSKCSDTIPSYGLLYSLSQACNSKSK